MCIGVEICVGTFGVAEGAALPNTRVGMLGKLPRSVRLGEKAGRVPSTGAGCLVAGGSRCSVTGKWGAAAVNFRGV